MKKSIRNIPVSIEIKSDKKYISAVTGAVECLMKELAYFEEEINEVCECVSEGVGNAVDWGNKQNSDKRVKIGILANRNNMSITITDQGTEHFDYKKYLKAFNKLTPENCVQTLDVTYAEKGHCSLGIANMRRLMDSLTYNDILENGKKIGTALILEYRHKQSNGELTTLIQDANASSA